MKFSFKYKHWVYLTVLVFILLSFILYNYSFKDTILLLKTNSSLKENNLKGNSNGGEISVVKTKKIVVDSLFNSYRSDSIIIGKKWLNQVGGFSLKNNVILKDLLLEQLIIDKQNKIATAKIILQGSFNNLERVLNYIETHKGLGFVEACEFKSYFDNQKKKEVLNLIVYIQYLKNHEKN